MRALAASRLAIWGVGLRVWLEGLSSFRVWVWLLGLGLGA